MLPLFESLDLTSESVPDNWYLYTDKHAVYELMLRLHEPVKIIDSPVEIIDSPVELSEAREEQTKSFNKKLKKRFEML